MWIEIITTAVTTAAATHWGPKAYELLVGKFVKVKAKVTPDSAVLMGRYIESVSKKDGASTIFKLKVTPAQQKTRMGEGGYTGPKGPADPRPLVWVSDNADNVDPNWEIDLNEESPKVDVKFAVVPPDYDSP
jgi:hypothetical protein